MKVQLFHPNIFSQNIKKKIIRLTENKIAIILIIILIFSFINKIYRINLPNEYIFDEVYVSFTAEEIAKNNPKAWVWDYPSPKGFAYGWSHPYMGKLIIASSIKLLGYNTFARRFPAAIAGTLLSLIVFFISQELFPKRKYLGLMASAIVALDGLVLTLSRIGLADTLLTLFLTISFYFLIKKKYIKSAIFWGFAISTKWTSLYFIPTAGIIILSSFIWEKNILKITANFIKSFIIALIYMIIGGGIYLLSYAPFFYYRYGIQKFIMLQKQMYWYHTGLVATHPSQSPAISWPLDYKPVWFWVKYGQDNISNIYALGNPIIFWFGVIAIFITFGYVLISKEKKLWILLLGYITFWLPWIGSPRIMFLYHYLPAIPFMSIIIAFVLSEFVKLNKKLIIIPIIFFMLTIFTFIYFYPFWTGIPIPKEKVNNYRWLESWR